MTETPVEQDQSAVNREGALGSLDRLVGTWQVSGSDDLSGTVRFEWLNGERNFLNAGGWEWPGGGYQSSMTRQPTALRPPRSGDLGDDGVR